MGSHGEAHRAWSHPDPGENLVAGLEPVERIIVIVIVWHEIMLRLDSSHQSALKFLTGTVEGGNRSTLTSSASRRR